MAFIKKRLQHRRFPVNIAKFLRIAFYRTPPVAASENSGPHSPVEPPNESLKRNMTVTQFFIEVTL